MQDLETTEIKGNLSIRFFRDLDFTPFEAAYNQIKPGMHISCGDHVHSVAAISTRTIYAAQDEHKLVQLLQYPACSVRWFEMRPKEKIYIQGWNTTVTHSSGTFPECTPTNEGRINSQNRLEKKINTEPFQILTSGRIKLDPHIHPMETSSSCNYVHYYLNKGVSISLRELCCDKGPHCPNPNGPPETHDVSCLVAACKNRHGGMLDHPRKYRGSHWAWNADLFGYVHSYFDMVIRVDRIKATAKGENLQSDEIYDSLLMCFFMPPKQPSEDRSRVNGPGADDIDLEMIASKVTQGHIKSKRR